MTWKLFNKWCSYEPEEKKWPETWKHQANIFKFDCLFTSLRMNYTLLFAIQRLLISLSIVNNLEHFLWYWPFKTASYMYTVCNIFDNHSRIILPSVASTCKREHVIKNMNWVGIKRCMICHQTFEISQTITQTFAPKIQLSWFCFIKWSIVCNKWLRMKVQTTSFCV